MVDEEIEEYAEDHTSPESDILTRLSRETHLTQKYPRMLSGHLQGTFLKMISHMVQPKRILEIGTFTGYSTLCLGGLTPSPSASPYPSPASSSPYSSPEGEGFILHTIDVDPELEEIIRKYLKEAGMEDCVILHIGDAMNIIPTLDEQWDLVFIDADKPNYLNYYKLVIDKVRSGGIILADNTLWGGKVLNPNPKDKDTIGIKEFNDFVQKDERVENVLLPIRDGIMLIQKR
jgi:caffeoyl-CoA O-methyltransferase